MHTARLACSAHLRHEDDQRRAAEDGHEYSYALGVIYNDIIAECEKLGPYAQNIVSRPGFGYVFER